MRRRLRAGTLGLAIALVAASQAGLAADLNHVAIRTGDHPGYGRIVIDAAHQIHYQMEQTGEHVVLRFDSDVTLEHVPAAPHNVVSLTTDGSNLDFVLAPNTTLHASRTSAHIVLDILDPEAARRPTPFVSEKVDPDGQEDAHPASHDRTDAKPEDGGRTAERKGRKPARGAAAAKEQAARANRSTDLDDKPATKASGPAASPHPASLLHSPELGGRTPVPAPSPPGRSQLAAQDKLAVPGSRPAPDRTVGAGPLPAPGETPAAPPDSVAAEAARKIASEPLASPLAAPLAPPLAVPLAARNAAADATELDLTQPEGPGRDTLPENNGPGGLLARRAKLPKDLAGVAFIVPFGDQTGAAAFQHGHNTFVVFDERRPVDMSLLKEDADFAQADVRLLANGTLLRVPTPDGSTVALSRTPRGWRVASLRAMPKFQPIVPAYQNGIVTLPAEQPGDVVTIADPVSGATLLVGTVRQPNQNIATGLTGTEFILRPTSLGVVVEPLSDAVTLKPIQGGFRLAGRPDGLAVSPRTAQTDALMDAAQLTRRLNFPGQNTDLLRQRLTRQVDETAMTEPGARGPKRLAAAQTMMALGMNAEAEGLMSVAADQDPKLATSPDLVALKAIAALLAGRVGDAAGLDDPRLTGTDEIALWRGVRQAMQDDGSPAAAAVFASTAPLAALYPKPIRDRILPLIAETMIKGGEVGPSARLLAKNPDDPALAYARALQKQAEGNTDQALVQLDQLADGHDQYDRARAAVRAVELRLSARKIDATQAADALDKLLYAWRGDQRELALRERVAELRGQVGNWRASLDILRQAETDFPDRAASVHDKLRAAFTAMVSSQGLGQMTPIDVVSAIDENADLLPSATGNPALEEELADRLLALDLPERAKPVLDKLMKSAATPDGKARFGATLAALDEREKDDTGALAALDASDSPGLPADLLEKRTLLRADAMARTGSATGAVALLAALGTTAATQDRAAILEQAKDWAGAQKAWTEYAATALPAAGPLNDDQARTLLRLATATARAGDDTTLNSLRATYDSRVTPGPLGDMFRLLTAEPVRRTSDLGRVQQEVNLAQSLPANLKALDGPSPAH